MQAIDAVQGKILCLTMGCCIAVLSLSSVRGQSPIAIGVKLGGNLSRICVPRGSSAEEVEKDLTASLYNEIIDKKHWAHFCWELEKLNPANPQNNRLLVELTDLAGINGEVLVQIQLKIAENDSPPLITFKLDDGRSISFPRGKLLKSLLVQEFAQEFLLSNEKCEDLHRFMRQNLRVAEGVIQKQAASDEPVGIVLLPWEKYGRYGQSKFSFRYVSGGMPINLPSEGVNVPLLFKQGTTSNARCCIKTRFTEKPTADRLDPVDVFLEQSYHEVVRMPFFASTRCSDAISASEPLGITVPLVP
jgi:hypothetical protein